MCKREAGGGHKVLWGMRPSSGTRRRAFMAQPTPTTDFQAAIIEIPRPQASESAFPRVLPGPHGRRQLQDRPKNPKQIAEFRPYRSGGKARPSSNPKNTHRNGDNCLNMCMPGKKNTWLGTHPRPGPRPVHKAEEMKQKGRPAGCSVKKCAVWFAA